MDYSYQLIKMMAKCSGANVADLNQYDIPEQDTINAAIKFMVEQSLFFQPDIVDARHKEMISDIADNKGLPVRFSRKMHGIQRDNNGDDYFLNGGGLKLILDKDGNRSVRKIINDKTGHIVSQGQNSTIKFANISHVWGEAYNPIFFSSLWNIVLIPSYCNPLMDKQSGDIALTIQNVYRAICKEIYQAEDKFGELNKNLGSGNKNPDSRDVEISCVANNPCDLTVTINDKKIEIHINYLQKALRNAAGPITIQDTDSYVESDIKAHKLLSDIKAGTKKSYVSYLKSVSNILEKKDISQYAGRSAKTILNWKSAVEFAKRLFAQNGEK